MSPELDARRLIAEVHKRPPLWDVRMVEYKDRSNTPLLWSEIAEVLGVDVEHCKRKWKNLRDAYRAEVRRTERRIARLKALGQFDPTRRICSKWVYFEPMSFINESKRSNYTARNNTMPDNDPFRNNSSPEQNHHPPTHLYEPGFHTFYDIKMEAHHTTTDEEEDEDDKLFEEFNAMATPQAARRLTEGFAANAAAAIELATKSSPDSGITNDVDAQDCKCDQHNDEQVHFLEDLEREEQKLMQSTRKEISRDNNVGHVGDADYNFLVSFLPQMKKMTELQNLQFRARMSDLLLTTMSTSPTSLSNYPNRIGCRSIQNAGGGHLDQLELKTSPSQHRTQQQQQQQQQSHSFQLVSDTSRNTNSAGNMMITDEMSESNESPTNVRDMMSSSLNSSQPQMMLNEDELRNGSTIKSKWI